MFAGAASVMTAAMRSPCSRERGLDGLDVVVRDDEGLAGDAAETPAESGRPRVATPEPAEASSASTWPW